MDNKKPIKGVLTLLPTPFDEKDELDLVAFKEQVSYLENVGMHGIVVASSAGEFYAVHKERPFYPDLLDFMTESEVVPMILEKENAVADLREAIGATDPAEAEEGTVRKLYAENKQNNIIHASDSDENAKIEIAFFFSQKEIIDIQ